MYKNQVTALSLENHILPSWQEDVLHTKDSTHLQYALYLRTSQQSKR